MPLATSLLRSHMPSISFTPEAELRLKKAPFFIRPLIRKKAAEAAKKRGLDRVTADLLAELKGENHDR